MSANWRRRCGGPRVGDGSKIEWTDATWGPTVGCKAVSPGCGKCYAARLASGRLRHLPEYAGLAENGVFNGTVRCLPERLDQPLRWKKPRRIFVDSMSDLFHPAVPDEFRLDVWQVMAAASQHSYQILTKRPQAMASFCRRLAWVMPPLTNVATGEPYLEKVDPITVVGWLDGKTWEDFVEDPLPGIWLGASIESDAYTFRADHLRLTPAAVRFLSLEPLLGPLPSLDLTGINWCIVGCESGPGARPMDLAWVYELRDKAREAGCAFFVKQLSFGEPGVYHDIIDFPLGLRIREYPA